MNGNSNHYGLGNGFRQNGFGLDRLLQQEKKSGKFSLLPHPVGHVPTIWGAEGPTEPPDKHVPFSELTDFY